MGSRRAWLAQRSPQTQAVCEDPATSHATVDKARRGDGGGRAGSAYFISTADLASTRVPRDESRLAGCCAPLRLARMSNVCKTRTLAQAQGRRLLHMAPSTWPWYALLKEEFSKRTAKGGDAALCDETCIRIGKAQVWSAVQ